MSRFLARIVMDNAGESDYHDLHIFMEAVGYKRWIAGSNGRRLHLPDAMYLYEGKANSETAFALAQMACKEVGLKHSIVLTSAEPLTYLGLKEVDP